MNTGSFHIGAQTLQEPTQSQKHDKIIVEEETNLEEYYDNFGSHVGFFIQGPVRQRRHFNLLEDLQIHYLELPKLPKKNTEELDDIELWLDFLKESPKEGSEKRLEELKERSEIMGTAINQLMEISADEKMRDFSLDKYRNYTGPRKKQD